MVSGTVRKKESINATVSPSLKKEVVEAVERGDYSSMSDAVSQGLTLLFGRERKKTIPAQEQHMGEERATYTDIGQFEREIWKQKGITFQKMGRLEDAIKCFDKALGINPERVNETKNRESIIYDHQKEKEECMRKLCPNPRELTPEEAKKAAAAKAYYRALRGEKEEPEEERVNQKQEESSGKKPRVLFDGEPKDYMQEWILE